MTKEQVADVVQNTFFRHFNIHPDNFHWERSIEELHADLKMLGNLVFLEQLLEKEFERKIPLLENIATAFHTPRDIVDLIIQE